MKKSFKCLLPVLLFVVLSSFAVHKFYVGIYQISYSEKKREVQIMARVFIDDFEKALESKFKKKIYLATPREIAETNELLKSYLSEKMQLTVNGKAKTLKFLGKETEDNVLICYFTVPVTEKITSMVMHNSVLAEIYPEQQNIIHFNIYGNKKSLLLTDSETEGEVEF